MTQETHPLFQAAGLFLRVARETANVRGYQVLVSTGEAVGTVTHLLIGDGEVPLYFLRIALNSLRKNGTEHRILPLNEVRCIGDGYIQLKVRELTDQLLELRANGD